MKKIIVILMVLFDLGCKHTAKQKTEYYSNGNKKSVAEIQHDVLDGKRIGYYEDGSIEYISCYKNDSLDGKSVFYDSSGKTMGIVNYKNGIKDGFFYEFFLSNGFIRTKGFYRQGILHGTLTQYFETDSARMMAKINYFNFRGEQKEFGSIWFDKNGGIIKEIRRVELVSANDTMMLGDTFELNMELKNPKFDSTIFIIGGYDENFYLNGYNRFDTLKSNNHKVNFTLKSKSRGIFFVRGYCSNRHEIKSNALETIIECSAPIYFEYQYYVK